MRYFSRNHVTGAGAGTGAATAALVVINSNNDVDIIICFIVNRRDVIDKTRKS